MAKQRMSERKLDRKLVQDISKKLPDRTLFSRVINDPKSEVTNECLAQTSHVVDYLYDNQIAFHLEQSTSGGYIQLQAVTDSPKARIVLTGKPEHIDFIGSGLKSTQRFVFSTTSYNRNGGRATPMQDVSRTYHPSKDDIYNLLNCYLKNDMSSFANPSDTRNIEFSNGRSRSVPNSYYQSGNLKKGYKTFTDEKGYIQDVELRIETTSGTNIDGETSSFENSVKTLYNAISNSHDYLVESIMPAAEYIAGKISVGNKPLSPSDYGIYDNDISDMVNELRILCMDSDSDYGIELAESMNKPQTIKDIISDYVDTQVLGLSKDEYGELLTIPEPTDDHVVSYSDIPEDFTVDPFSVSNWTALSENDANILSRQRIQSAMRGIGLTKDNIVGDDNRNASMADALIKFDESTAKSKEDYEPGSFERRILEHTENYLKEIGITATCRFDNNGLIDVSGNAIGITAGRNGDVTREVPVHALIGQIFSPDEHNVVHVTRNSNANFLFVPGYRAFVEENKPGENKHLMERTILTGYFDSATMAIDDALTSLISASGKALKNTRQTQVDIALPTSCNSVYGETYGTRLAENSMEYMTSHGFDEDDMYAIYDVLSHKIAYSKEMDAEATTINSIGGESQKTRALEIAGQNIREMGDECIGYCYTNMTNTGRGSGTRRYLISTASVADDGHIIPGDPDDIVSPLFNRPMFAGSDYNALDRNVMSFLVSLTANGVEKHAKGANLTLQGNGLEDGFTFSKEFCESHTVPSIESTEYNIVERPLKLGDKVSDTSGNKGVISTIIDRNMPMEEAERLGIGPTVQFFKDNPDIDFVSSPYSGMSRSNAGTAFFMLQDHEDLNLPDGRVVKGGIGTLPILITGMTVDSKTHVYEESGDHHRNASGQLSWILSSKKLGAIAREIYGDNEAGLNELRAYLNIIGVTLDEKGNLYRGFGADSSNMNRGQLVDDMSQDDGSGLAKVKRFDEYVLDTNPNPDKVDKLQIKNSAAKWDAEAKDFNGFLALPFTVQGADGKDLIMRCVDNDGKEHDIPVMPVVSAMYRSDIQHDNGETYNHDYTKNYAKIIRHAGEYMSAAKRISNVLSDWASSHMSLLSDFGSTKDEIGKSLFAVLSSPYSREKMDSKITVDGKETQVKTYMNMIVHNMNQHIKANDGLASDASKALASFNKLFSEYNGARISGQSEYMNIVNDTVSKKFEDRKHGAFANSIIKVGCKNSATAVWTSDPRLSIDEVAMPRFMYDQLKIKDDHILMWRDPLLRDTGMRYMKVVINDDLTGIAINPMIAKMFDGDFDGDTAGLYALQTLAAQKEALQKLTIKANILDYGVGENGHHPIILQDGMDVKAAKFANPDIADAWKKLEEIANKECGANGVISDETFDKINQLCKDTLNASSFQNIMSYESPQAVAESLIKMSKEFGNGAKGSVKKAAGYMKYLGYDLSVDDKGNCTVTEAPMTKEERFERNREVCIALGCKCDETGVAGYASQKAIRALRDICPTEALELTYPVTQGMLQAKHDASEAKLKAHLTQNVIPDLWEGKRLIQDDNGDWNLSHDSVDGRSIPAQASTDEWKSQFMRIMCQANGIDVPSNATYSETRKEFSSIMNPDALDIVANAMTDKESGCIVGVTKMANSKASFIDKMMYGVPSNGMGSTTITDEIMRAASQADKGHPVNIFNHGGDIFAPDSVRKANGWSMYDGSDLSEDAEISADLLVKEQLVNEGKSMAD